MIIAIRCTWRSGISLLLGHSSDINTVYSRVWMYCFLQLSKVECVLSVLFAFHHTTSHNCNNRLTLYFIILNFKYVVLFYTSNTFFTINICKVSKIFQWFPPHFSSISNRIETLFKDSLNLLTNFHQNHLLI